MRNPTLTQRVEWLENAKDNLRTNQQRLLKALNRSPELYRVEVSKMGWTTWAAQFYRPSAGKTELLPESVAPNNTSLANFTWRYKFDAPRVTVYSWTLWGLKRKLRRRVFDMLFESPKIPCKEREW